MKRFEKAEEERTLKKNGQDWSSMQSVNSRIKTDSLTGRHEEAESTRLLLFNVPIIIFNSITQLRV